MDIKLKKNERIEIEWLDVVEDSNWMSEEEAGKVDTETYCKAIGYFLKQNDTFIWISTMISARRRKGSRSRTIIPKGMVTKIRQLNIKRK